MKQLMFTFRSTTSDIGSSTNGQVGTVIMATNYNASSPVFTDKKTMLEYSHAASCKTTEPMIHGVECDPAKLSGAEGKYIRTNPVLVGEDLKSYDHGTFQIAVSGTPGTTAAPGFANQSIGELWVSYTVSLRKPKFYTNLGLGISRDIYVSGANSEGTTSFMGTQAALLSGQQNNIGCLIALSPNNITCTFPASYSGNVVVTLLTEGPSGTHSSANTPSLSVTGNVVRNNDMYAYDSSNQDIPGNFVFAGWGTAANTGIFQFHITVAVATSGVNNTFNIQTTGGSAVCTQGCLDITEYNTFGRSGAAPVLINSAGTVITP